MNIKIHSSDINRMMKIITQCIDPKDSNRGNIEIIYENNLFSIRSSNGTYSAVTCTPVLGGDGESFCVDGTMFARVCAMCNGEISIITDSKTCTIKGAGRTRLPIVDAKIPSFERVEGKTCTVPAEAFSKGYGNVAYAISADQSRIQLTGVRVRSTDNGIEMMALDGFKMAVENILCDTEEMNIVIPGAFMKLISIGTFAGETVTIQTDGKRIQASTDGMMISCGLLAGEFPDLDRIIPKEFKTETLVGADSMQSALKSGSVVNTNNNLVKLNVEQNNLTVMSNSEQADFDAEVACVTNGQELKIAFNLKYLMETIASIGQSEIVMKFNSSVSPCILQGKENTGFRLILPVRVAG